MRSFRYAQPTPMNTWYVVHNMNTRNIEVRTTNILGTRTFGVVEKFDNHVTVDFGTPMAGQMSITKLGNEELNILPATWFDDLTTIQPMENGAVVMPRGVTDGGEVLYDTRTRVSPSAFTTSWATSAAHTHGNLTGVSGYAGYDIMSLRSPNLTGMVNLGPRTSTAIPNCKYCGQVSTNLIHMNSNSDQITICMECMVRLFNKLHGLFGEELALERSYERNPDIMPDGLFELEQ